MELDVMGLIGAVSYALDCVEAELAHVADRHAKRVAYMSVCMAKELGTGTDALQDLTICALLHDNALTQYISEELNNDIPSFDVIKHASTLGIHCVYGENNVSAIPFRTDVKGAVLYHHENADGSGPFRKTWQEIPMFARIIHLCDFLDVYCRTRCFTDETWEKARTLLESVRGKTVDSECADAFFRAFTKEHFLTLSDDDLETRLWKMVPRENWELDFDRIKSLADLFARIVDYKSPFTSTHSMGVAADAEKMARFMGFDELTAEKMYLAGALHDIGKVAVGNEILEKPGRLDEKEFSVMKDHASYTYRILSGINGFDELRDWAALHHERLDGTGYPFGKTAAELNTQERIMACVDIYQALTESRPYKDGMPHEKACAILRDMADRGWLDRDIVEKTAKCFA